MHSIGSGFRMSTLTTKPITSISEFMHIVEGYTDLRWYRGVGDASYNLIPSLYRHPSLNDANLLFRQEYEILKRFKQNNLIRIRGDSLSHFERQCAKEFSQGCQL
jgi:hypothetical protein